MSQSLDPRCPRRSSYGQTQKNGATCNPQSRGTLRPIKVVKAAAFLEREARVARVCAIQDWTCLEAREVHTKATVIGIQCDSDRGSQCDSCAVN